MTIDEIKNHCEKVINPDGKIAFDKNSKTYQEHKLTLDIINELQCYKELERQGRLIELPCKVGDTVYVVTRNFISELEITMLSKTGRKEIFYKWMLKCGIYPNLDGFFSNELGKNVFITMKEAEKRLEEMKNGKSN